MVALTFCGCESDDVQTKQLIVNGDVENGGTLPDFWWFSTGLDNYNVTWTEEGFFSPKKSL